MSTRYWLHHWRIRDWKKYQDGYVLRHVASNSFSKQGVISGDVIYAVSLSGGELFLGGKLVVDRIIDLKEAIKLFGKNDVYPAKYHAVARDNSGSVLNIQKSLAPEVSKEIHVKRKKGARPLRFSSPGVLDNQTTRGLPELTEASAQLFDSIIEYTDSSLLRNPQICIDKRMLEEFAGSGFKLPDEISDPSIYTEGCVRRIVVNRYERDARARLKCLEVHGTRCTICRFSFESIYGEIAKDYIHVHHIKPLSECGGSYQVDPVNDLRPVCPNCHAVLHLGGVSRTIDEVQELLSL